MTDITKKTIIIICVCLSVFFSSPIFTGSNAESILKMVDEYNSGMKAPGDVEMSMVMNIHNGGAVKTRELKTWTKNNTDKNDWRVMKFLSPADMAGIGLLIMAENQMYLYLPEFHRIRRIASSNKKSSFQGSDFSYDDLSTMDFSEAYSSKIMKEDDQTWLLELSRKQNADKPYKRIILSVAKENYMPQTMEMFDDRDEAWKKMEYKIKQVGKYNIISYIKIEDKKKSSFTTLEMKDIKLDQGIDDDIFTQRFLKRKA